MKADFFPADGIWSKNICGKNSASLQLMIHSEAIEIKNIAVLGRTGVETAAFMGR